MPLANWGITENECLEYCYSKGFEWLEDGKRLYDILDRVSCWCCRNKNLKELKNMYLYLPQYWQKLKNMQDRIKEPYYKNKLSIYDLEYRFAQEIQLDEEKEFMLSRQTTINI